MPVGEFAVLVGRDGVRLALFMVAVIVVMGGLMMMMGGGLVVSGRLEMMLAGRMLRLRHGVVPHACFRERLLSFIALIMLKVFWN